MLPKRSRVKYVGIKGIQQSRVGTSWYQMRTA